MALLTQSLRTANVVAKNYCDVYRLTKIDFISIGQDYPELEESFHRIMVRRVKDKAA
jgi:CRP-like cAMP-binding protein